jgi:signal transduction histidine kinase
MDPQYSPQSRTERVIATLRVVLGAGSLFAVWLDPTQPAKYESTTYGLMTVYVVYSFLLAVLLWSSHLPLPRLRFVTHGVDLVVFSVFIYLTEGPPVSPFFVYFVFSLVCAALRWGWKGTLLTSSLSLGIFIAMGLYESQVLSDEKLNRFVIRSVYLAVISILLAYLGAYEHQLRGEITKLAGWPRGVPRDAPAVVRQAMEHAAHVLNAPRVVMVWEEPEEPWRHLATWSEGKFEMTREPSVTVAPLVAPALAAASFLCPDLTAPSPTVVHSEGNEVGRWYGQPLDTALQARFVMTTVLSLRLEGEGWDGRLFVLDKPGMTSDDLVLGRVIAQQVLAQIEHVYLLQSFQQTAAMQERVRLARDLHDGLLQSLTGSALQLQAVRRLLDGAPAAALDRLSEVQQLIVTQQRNLRTFIHELRPVALVPSPPGTTALDRLRELGERVQRQWAIAVNVHAEAGVEIPDALIADVSHIVHEALVNAARHGKASSARVEVETREGSLHLRVEDNGCGFPFSGRYALPELLERDLGPSSLKERVASLHGTLVLESGESGARLDIGLPLQASEI